MPAQPIPQGYENPIPSLSVDGGAQAIEFYKRAFGATERARMDGPGGTVAHAELEIGSSVVMLADPFPQGTCKPPRELGGTSVSVFLYVEDVDAVVAKAVEAGATVAMPVDDMFWGDRWGSITDPFGHLWELATHKEDLAPEEIQSRGEEAMASMG